MSASLKPNWHLQQTAFSLLLNERIQASRENLLFRTLQIKKITWIKNDAPRSHPACHFQQGIRRNKCLSQVRLSETPLDPCFLTRGTLCEGCDAYYRWPFHWMGYVLAFVLHLCRIAFSDLKADLYCGVVSMTRDECMTID